LKKREDFAISLRKKKKEEILREKRRRLLDSLPKESPSKNDASQSEAIEFDQYRDCPLFIFDESEGVRS